jgi:hypothetical protein
MLIPIFSSLEIFLILVGTEIQYASIVLNLLTVTDCGKVEGAQSKFTNLSHNRLFKNHNS